MIANLEALFILRRFRSGRLHDEMLFAWLKPLTLDEHDFVSFGCNANDVGLSA